MDTEKKQAGIDLANLLTRLHQYIRQDLSRGVPPLAGLWQSFDQGQMRSLCHTLDLPRIFRVLTGPMQVVVRRDSNEPRVARKENPTFKVAIVPLNVHRIRSIKECRLCVESGWREVDLIREIHQWENSAHQFSVQAYDDPADHEWQWDNAAVELERWENLVREMVDEMPPIEWTDERLPDQWEKVFDIGRTELNRRIASGEIRANRVKGKRKYAVHVDDLPKPAPNLP